MLMEGLKMDDFMEAEGLRESDVCGIGEIEEIKPILPMQFRRVHRQQQNLQRRPLLLRMLLQQAPLPAINQL